MKQINVWMKVKQKFDILQHIALYMKLTIRIIQQDFWQMLIKSSKHEQKRSTNILKRWHRCVCKVCERSPADKSGLGQGGGTFRPGWHHWWWIPGNIFGLSCILIRGIGVIFVLTSFTLVITKSCLDTEKGPSFSIFNRVLQLNSSIIIIFVHKKTFGTFWNRL